MSPAESQIRPTIRLSNGASVSINQISQRNWTGTIDVEAGRSYTATVVWVENFEGSDLPLAQLTQELEVANDGSVIRGNATEYSTDFDADSDGMTNLQERQAGTDPNIADNTSAPDPDGGDETPAAPTDPDEPDDTR